jgi:hypothetical protein
MPEDSNELYLYNKQDMGIFGFRMFAPEFCDQLMEVHHWRARARIACICMRARDGTTANES